MARVAFEIVLNSASDFESLQEQGYKKLYVVVSFSTDPKNTQKTHVVRINGGTHLSWSSDSKMKFSVDVSTLKKLPMNVELVFHLKCKRTLRYKQVGELRVPIRDLLRRKAARESVQVVTYSVNNGSLTFSYSYAIKSIDLAKIIRRLIGNVAFHVAAHAVAPPMALGVTAVMVTRQLIIIANNIRKKYTSREGIGGINALNSNMATDDPSTSDVDGALNAIDPSSIADEALLNVSLETLDPSLAVDLIVSLLS